ncbi:unnamed protein product [Heterosigma akashiwo]
MASRFQSLQTVFWLFLGNAVYNTARKSLSVASPLLMDELNFSKMEIGSITSSFTLCYGLSKFIGGVLSDMFSNKVLFTAGLFCAGLTQFIFGASSSLTVFCLVWAVNGLVQGVGWPALSGIVLRWFPKEQRGRAFAVLTASGNLGLVAAPALLSRAMAAAGGSWRGGFYAEGALCAAVAALGFLFLRDAPPAAPAAAGKAEGAAAAGAARQQQAPAVTVPTDGAAGGARKPGVAVVFMEHIVGRPLFWALCVADVANYLAIKTLSDWAALYGIEARGMDEPPPGTGGGAGAGRRGGQRGLGRGLGRAGRPAAAGRAPVRGRGAARLRRLPGPDPGAALGPAPAGRGGRGRERPAHPRARGHARGDCPERGRHGGGADGPGRAAGGHPGGRARGAVGRAARLGGRHGPGGRLHGPGGGALLRVGPRRGGRQGGGGGGGRGEEEKGLILSSMSGSRCATMHAACCLCGVLLLNYYCCCCQPTPVVGDTVCCGTS